MGGCDGRGGGREVVVGCLVRGEGGRRGRGWLSE